MTDSPVRDEIERLKSRIRELEFTLSPRQHELSRIKSRIIRKDGHSLWTGALSNDRPICNWRGTRVQVARLLWDLCHPEHPLAGARLIPACTRHACVDPAHHRPGPTYTAAPEDLLLDEPRPTGRPRQANCAWGHEIETLPTGRRLCRECARLRSRGAHPTQAPRSLDRSELDRRPPAVIHRIPAGDPPEDDWGDPEADTGSSLVPGA